MRRLLVFLVCLLALLAAAPVRAQTASPSPRPTDDPNGGTRVDYKADKVEYRKEEGLYRLSGHVDLHVRDIEIKTEELDYDFNHKILRSKVPFEMIQTPKDGSGARNLKGKSFVYNVDLRRIEAQEVYLVVPAKMPGQEVYIQGDLMTAYNDGQRVVMYNGFFTTCNHFEGQLPAGQGDEDPYSRAAVSRRATHYAVEGEVMDYIDNDRLLVWNAQVLTFENPAFWFPFWYVPLQGPPGISKPDLDVGQNPYEGVFAKFKGYYQWNEYHDGYWFLSLMEKKGIGLGFQHDWIAYPNSISRIYFYGLPLTKDLISWPGSLVTLPTIGETDTLQTQQLGDNPGFLDYLGQYLSNKFQDHDFKLEHHQLLLPHLEAAMTLTDRDFYNSSPYISARTPQRSLALSLNDNELFNLDPYNDLTLNTTLTLNQSSNETIDQKLQSDRIQVLETRTQTQSQTRQANVTAQLGKGNLTLNSNWQNAFNQSHQSYLNPITIASPAPDASASPATTQQLVQQEPTGNESWNNSLAFTSALDDKTNLSLNLNMSSQTNGIGNAATPQGTLQQTLQPRLSLTQNHDWGSIAVNYDDFFDLSPSQSASLSGQLKKLPELNLNFNPFFQNVFPIQLSSIIGRYLEPGSGVVGPSEISEISRSKFQLALVSKELDLGLGNKVNFGSTSFEQRFYQTLDAEYRFTGNVMLRNDLSKYFIPSLTYSRTITDPENHSPFKNFDALALSENNLLSVDLRLINLPEFTMLINGGYNYLSREYQPIRANITSEIGNRFALRFNTGYSFANIHDADVGQLLKDSKGNVYRHGDPVNGPTFTVKPEDVGSFNPYGGTWDTSTLGVHWRSTDYDIITNNLNTFGLDSGIPEGLDLGSSITYNFDQGKLDNITGQLKWIFGSSWQWHTEVDFTVTIRPTNLTSTGPTNWLALEFPFNIAVRKDLHDFILSLSWDSFYQQFNINLQLLAFPNLSTSSLLGNVNSLGQQINSGLSSTGVR